MNEDFDLNEDFNEEGTSGFADLRKAGIYDVTLKHVSKEVKANGVTEWGVTVNSGGEYDDTFYGAAVKFASGKEFGINQIIKPLFGIAGVTQQVLEDKTIDTSKGHKQIKVYAGLTGIPIKVAVQLQWNTYYGEFKPKIIRVFASDGRTYSEIKAGTPDAEQIKKVDLSPKMSDHKGKAPTPGQATKQDVDVDLDDDGFDLD